MLLARLPCIKFSPLCAFDGVAEKSCKVGCATDCIGRAAAPLSLIAIKPFCRLPAANHRLAGANYGLAAAYDRLVGANETQQRQMQGEMTFASAACGSMRLIKSSLTVRPGDIGRWNDGLLRLLVRS